MNLPNQVFKLESWDHNKEGFKWKLNTKKLPNYQSFTCDLALTSIWGLSKNYLNSSFWHIPGADIFSWCRYFSIKSIWLWVSHIPDGGIFPSADFLDSETIWYRVFTYSWCRYFSSGPIWLWVFAYSWCRYLTALNYGSSLPTLPWTACEESRIWILENFDFWAGVGI